MSAVSSRSRMQAFLASLPADSDANSVVEAGLLEAVNVGISTLPEARIG
ncbi:hypothetical protein [Actinobaculum sp. 313]|nr:hypothetical protein [Actinobaculum sp. 313]